jgi:hypothetical protein
MNVDESARHAATVLRESVTRDLDLDAMRGELDRTRARRRRTRWVASVAALAVVIGILAVAARSVGSPAPAPAVRPPTSSTAALPREEQLLVGSHLREVGGGFTKPDNCLLSSTAFSPDGGRIAFTCAPGEERAGAYVVDVDGGPPRRILEGRTDEVAWAADGSEVLVSRGDSLEVMAPDQPASRSSVPLPKGWTVASIDLDDRDRVVATGTVDGRWAIVTLDLDGGRPQVVLTDPVPPLLVRWSPDGTEIGFLRRAARPSEAVAADVTVETVHPDGTGRTVLVKDGKAAFAGVGPGFDWSREGRIAYVTVVDGTGHLRIRSADGTVSDAGSPNGPVSWRPSRS